MHVKQHDIQVAKDQVKDFIKRVKQWLASYRLRLNPNKTEIMWCASSCHHSDQLPLVVDQAVIEPSLGVHDLGIQLRADMYISDHISAVLHSGFYNIHQRHRLRSSLIYEALPDAVFTLVLSRVDYGNSLYASAPATFIKQLQIVVNMVSRIICIRSRFDHITDFTRDYLHWLPIQ